MSRQRPSVGDLPPVASDEGALLRPLTVSVVVDTDHGDLIVGEQVTFDRLSEYNTKGSLAQIDHERRAEENYRLRERYMLSELAELVVILTSKVT